MVTVPVIAHPERNLVFARDPDRLARLVGKGALAQVTAGSIVGDFGRGAKLAAQEFFRRGLIHVIASDSHSLGGREPRLTAARDIVRKEWGEQAERRLFDLNPQAVIDSASVA
jgi:protein-tyrosine phosphatase